MPPQSPPLKKKQSAQVLDPQVPEASLGSPCPDLKMIADTCTCQTDFTNFRNTCEQSTAARLLGTCARNSNVLCIWVFPYEGRT